MRDVRCKYCNKLFFKADIKDADIEIKCRNCKNFCTIRKRGERTLLLSDERGDYNK